jgi:hypothetical protein
MRAVGTERVPSIGRHDEEKTIGYEFYGQLPLWRSAV